MEMLDLPGYTEAEKFQIALRFLVPRQLKASGLTEAQCQLSDDAIRSIIRDYTREAGVRSLERQIGAVFRYVALRVAEDRTTRERIEPSDLTSILGHRRFENEVALTRRSAGLRPRVSARPHPPVTDGQKELGDAADRALDVRIWLAQSRGRGFEDSSSTFERERAKRCGRAARV